MCVQFKERPVRTKNFPKNYFLPPDMERTCACQEIRNVSFTKSYCALTGFLQILLPRGIFQIY